MEYVWFGKSGSACKAEFSLYINRKMNLMFIASCGFVCPRNTTTTVYNYKAPSGCSIRAQCDNWLLCKSNWLDFYVPQQADSITMSIIFSFISYFLFSFCFIAYSLYFCFPVLTLNTVDYQMPLPRGNYTTLGAWCAVKDFWEARQKLCQSRVDNAAFRQNFWVLLLTAAPKQLGDEY